MRSEPIHYKLTRHYIYNKMRSVPSLYRHETLYLQYNEISTHPLLTRDTIFTIKCDQYTTFIDTRHYIYNKVRSVPSLNRLTRHYMYNKMRSVP